MPEPKFGSGLPFLPSVGFMPAVPSSIYGTVQSMVFSLPN
jgi:hypothetical protein